jgi:hypothetical protein
VWSNGHHLWEFSPSESSDRKRGVEGGLTLRSGGGWFNIKGIFTRGSGKGRGLPGPTLLPHHPSLLLLHHFTFFKNTNPQHFTIHIRRAHFFHIIMNVLHISKEGLPTKVTLFLKPQYIQRFENIYYFNQSSRTYVKILWNSFAPQAQRHKYLIIKAQRNN